jgi:hypothetical protein
MAKWDAITQLYYGGEWHDAPAYTRDPITITRGYADEQSEASPSELLVTLDNRDGTYNPRNPVSELYGAAGRNTPARVVLSLDTPITISEGFESDQLGISISSFSATRGPSTKPWARDDSEAHSGSWSLRSGDITHEQASYAVVSVPGGATSVSFWYKVSSEEGFDTFSVWVDDDEDSPEVEASGEVDWTQATISLNDAQTLTFTYVKDILDTEGGDAAWIDDLVFTVEADVRGTGAALWRPDRTVDFDPDAEPRRGDSWTEVTAAGVMRRLEQAREVILSPIRRRALAARTIDVSAESLIDTVAAYWPCEDSAGSTQLASGLPSGAPLELIGDVEPARYTDMPGSDALPVFGEGGNFSGAVPATVDTTGSLHFHIWLAVPETVDTPDDTILFNLYCTGGSIVAIAIVYDTANNGSVRIVAMDRDWNAIDETETIEAFPPGERLKLHIGLVQLGSDVDVTVYRTRIRSDSSIDVVTTNSALFDVTLGRCYQVTGGGSGQMRGWAFGHIGVSNAEDWLFVREEAEAQWVLGYAGEYAGNRFLRLCAESGVSGVLVGNVEDTAPMGPQAMDTFLNLLTEVERTDAGLLYDARDRIGLVYRTRRSLYNQTAKLELDWSEKHVAPPSLPVLDDQYIRNDVTVTRRSGSSYRLVQESGPLNVQQPEDDAEGVGRYAVQVDTNPEQDSGLRNLAGWYLSLGTVDEQRFPQITVDLDAFPELAEAAAAVDVGDLITVDNMPTDLSPDQVRLLVRGYTEVIGSHRRLITFNCVPAAPYQVAVYDQSRYAAKRTYRHSSSGPITTTQTDITFRSDVPWVTDPDQFPFDIMVSGERMTVTAIGTAVQESDGEYRQLWTVIRSVNGVVKSHPVGVTVQLAEPPRYAL